MRAGAQLREFPLFVEGNRLALLRMLADELHLIGFVFLLHNLNRIIRRKLKPLQRQRFLHDFFISASILASDSGVNGSSASKS